jgi:hypothetical protein
VKFLFVCFERSTQHDCSAMFVVESTTAERAPWNAARLYGQALFPAGSDFPERVKVFLHESLRALIGPIQADT